MNGSSQGVIQSTCEISQLSSLKKEDVIINAETPNKKTNIKYCNKKVQVDFQKDIQTIQKTEAMCMYGIQQANQTNQRQVLSFSQQAARLNGNISSMNLSYEVLFPCWKFYFYIPQQAWCHMLFSMGKPSYDKENDQKLPNKGFQPYHPK